MPEIRSLVGCSECKRGFPLKQMTCYGDETFLCPNCEKKANDYYLSGKYCGACGDIDCDCTAEMKRKAFKEAHE